MGYLKAFAAGILATVAFHQVVIAALHAAGLTSIVPYSLEPTAPFGVPAVVSMALWGGVWGAMLWRFVGRVGPPRAFWMWAVVLGTVCPTLITLFVVNPLKHMPVAFGWDVWAILGTALVNAAWGFGFALFVTVASRLSQRGET